MNSVMMPSNHMAPVGVAGGLSLNWFASRLKGLVRTTARKPGWARVPDRAWQRNSALLTYRHEALTGRQ